MSEFERIIGGYWPARRKSWGRNQNGIRRIEGSKARKKTEPEEWNGMEWSETGIDERSESDGRLIAQIQHGVDVERISARKRQSQGSGVRSVSMKSRSRTPEFPTQRCRDTRSRIFEPGAKYQRNESVGPQ